MRESKKTDGFSEDAIEKPVAPPSERLMRGPDSIANSLAGVVRRFAPKYGFVASDVVTDWESIAGAEIAKLAEPARLDTKHGVLYVRLKIASAVGVAQYSFGKIADRVNDYFGYEAVKSVRVERKGPAK
ncbi:MAG: DUF721 domain-containing protein [Rickettsiales bacterium]|jgi:hypothetical protein|nr:DUF721 domain-containing protein [Rickettsiales bacterium]